MLRRGGGPQKGRGKTEAVEKIRRRQRGGGKQVCPGRPPEQVPCSHALIVPTEKGPLVEGRDVVGPAGWPPPEAHVQRAGLVA